MTDTNNTPPDIDWNLTTWEGSRRETMRRWAQLPLEKVIAALEEMEQLNTALAAAPKTGNSISEPAGNYPPPSTTPDEKK
ncbi:MAG: hypothetical protein QG652_846 [Pseudomonadota bacterium]|nr:hypothetical protein [Pseudomonadota bacterium]